jgi:hypothetical protein
MVASQNTSPTDSANVASRAGVLSHIPAHAVTVPVLTRPRPTERIPSGPAGFGLQNRPDIKLQPMPVEHYTHNALAIGRRPYKIVYGPCQSDPWRAASRILPRAQQCVSEFFWTTGSIVLELNFMLHA